MNLQGMNIQDRLATITNKVAECQRLIEDSYNYPSIEDDLDNLNTMLENSKMYAERILMRARGL